MLGKGVLIYPGHKLMYGYLEKDKLIGDITEITYNQELDKVFKITGYYSKGEK
jgi:hypothetical protein